MLTWVAVFTWLHVRSHDGRIAITSTMLHVPAHHRCMQERAGLPPTLACHLHSVSLLPCACVCAQIRSTRCSMTLSSQSAWWQKWGQVRVDLPRHSVAATAAVAFGHRSVGTQIPFVWCMRLRQPHQWLSECCTLPHCSPLQYCSGVYIMT